LRPPAIAARVQPRPRISALLDGDTRIVAVVGPAGYGKTVAVAQWAETAGIPVAWLTIDPHDRPAARFWRYVAAALSTAVPTLGDETIRSLDEWGPEGFDIATTLLAELGEDRPEIALVLDDVHLISDDIADQLAFFLDRSPLWLRTILCARSEPKLPLARWHLQGVLTQVRQQTLALTADEAEAALKGFEGLELGRADVGFLVRRIDGWAAALQLVALALVGRLDPSRFVSDVVGTDRMLFDYIVSDVLDRLPGKERDAVLVLSLLDDIDGARCTAMTGAGDGQLLLRRLVEWGLPLVTLDTDRTVVRYHQLFRDLVREELTIRRAGDVPGLHRRAAAAEQAVGDVAGAVRHLIAAGDTDRAFELVIEPFWDLYRAGRTGEAAAWLDPFPESYIDENPNRAVRFATALALVGRLDRAAMWNDRAAALPSGDEDVALELHVSRMVVHTLRGDTPAARADVSEILRLSPDGVFPWDPEGRLLTLMTVNALVEDELPEATAWMNALWQSPRVPERGRSVGNPARRAWLEFERGALVEAEQRADTTLANAGDVRRGAGHALVEALVVKARVATERLDLDQADVWVEQAIELADHLRDPLHRSIAREALVGAIEARSGAAEAQRALDEFAALAEFGPGLRQRHELLAAELAARAGRFDDAERRVADLPASTRRQLVLARVAVGRGGTVTKEDLPLIEANGAISRIIQAELLQHLSRRDEVEHLHRALEAGIDRGFVHTFLREGPLVAASLRRAVWQHRPWRSSPLAAALRDGRTDDAETTHSLVEPLSARELDILRLLPSHLSTVDLAARYYVSVNTIRTHIKAIYRKLGVGSRADAVRGADALGLLTRGHDGD
jgi:LuxR family maltose regulon positive regulatory protein